MGGNIVTSQQKFVDDHYLYDCQIARGNRKCVGCDGYLVVTVYHFCSKTGLWLMFTIPVLRNFTNLKMHLHRFPQAIGPENV